tara:strand:+ start:114 stop:482 length:369 start_codon:yes stop_codon:yes gene_type:complete
MSTFDEIHERITKETLKSVKGLTGYDRITAIQDYLFNKYSSSLENAGNVWMNKNGMSDRDVCCSYMKSSVWMTAENQTIDNDITEIKKRHNTIGAKQEFKFDKQKELVAGEFYKQDLNYRTK